MLGERVRRLREARAWTQEHLADASGVSLRTVQRLEAGAGFASETALAVAAALNVDVRELLDTVDGGNWLWPEVPLWLKLVVPVLLSLPASVWLMSRLLVAAGVEVPEVTMSPVLLLGGPLVAAILPLATMVHPRSRPGGSPYGIRELTLKPRAIPLYIALAALAGLICVFAYFGGHAIGHLARVAGL
jgi:transcriptional regulator with XRE-family HTH domain